MSWGKYGLASLIMLVASVANADLVTFNVYAAYAPSGPSGTGWDGYVTNALSGITGGGTTVPLFGDRNTDPTVYEPASIVEPYEMIVSNFESWRGDAAPTVFSGTPNAGTLGNRIHYGLHIASTADMPFSLQDISWELDSNDADDFFDDTGNFASANYSPTRVGINYGPNNLPGGGDDIVYDNGESGGLPIHDLKYVGVGTAFEANGSDASTDQEAIDDALRSILSGCDGCDVTLTGRYLIDESVFGQEVIRSDDVLISIKPGLGGDFDRNGIIDCDDIDLLTQETAAGTNDILFDLTSDGLVDFDDISEWVDVIKHTWFGDANCDGEFNSGDLVDVFVEAKYETGQPATWSSGDWNGDGFFESGDLVLAFVHAGYEKGPRWVRAEAVPEPASLGLLLIGLVAVVGLRRKK